MTHLTWALTVVAILAAAQANFTRNAYFDQFFQPEPLHHLDPPFVKEICNADHDMHYHTELEKSDCNFPKLVLVKLKVPLNILVRPHQAWVSRCIGACHSSSDHCSASKTKDLEVPVRVFSASTKKWTCGTYRLVEHSECNCPLEAKLEADSED
ncbi:uncharacterized protein LOC135073524 [Ostrinia nubilalis]|uniref:uncharacterized protein LOC135073524 n=1 Tax=Ostrinia nubilalis TaxID=29057 RepID=UPI003082601F